MTDGNARYRTTANRRVSWPWWAVPLGWLPITSVFIGQELWAHNGRGVAIQSLVWLVAFVTFGFGYYRGRRDERG